MKEQNESKLKVEPKMVEVNPEKDHVIHFNEYHIELKKGEKCKVPEMFLANLKTEKVIKKVRF